MTPRILFSIDHPTVADMHVRAVYLVALCRRKPAVVADRRQADLLFSDGEIEVTLILLADGGIVGHVGAVMERAR